MLLLNSLGFIFFIDIGLALGEFMLDSLERSNWTVEPRMSLDLGHAWSEGGIKLKHTCDEIFELFGEESLRLVLGMSLPEKIGTVGTDQSVEGIAGLSS